MDEWKLCFAMHEGGIDIEAVDFESMLGSEQRARPYRMRHRGHALLRMKSANQGCDLSSLGSVVFETRINEIVKSAEAEYITSLYENRISSTSEPMAMRRPAIS